MEKNDNTFGLRAQAINVMKIWKIMVYGVTGSSALVVDGEVVLYGRVPNAKEAKKITS
ncbi:MAG: thioredoxin family protein [Candidatus Micrarchaeia archaeon]